MIEQDKSLQNSIAENPLLYVERVAYNAMVKWQYYLKQNATPIIQSN